MKNTFFLVLFLLGRVLIADDLFTIKDISVAASPTDEMKASEVAFQEAARIALHALIHTLIPNITSDAMRSIEWKDVESVIRNFSIANESIEDERYSATFTFNFYSDRINDIFAKLPMGYEKPSMVIPLFYDENEPYLWDNEWREAWEDFQRYDDIMILPDNRDNVLTVHREDIAERDLDILDDLLLQYDLHDILIVTAKYDNDDIYVEIYRPYFSQVKKIKYAHSHEHSQETVIQNVVMDVVKKIRQGMISPSIYEQVSGINNCTVVVTDVDNWLKIRDHALNGLDFTIQYLSAKIIVLELDLHDDTTLESLTAALAKQELNITNHNDVMVIA